MKKIISTCCAFLLTISYCNSQIRAMGDKPAETKIPTIYDIKVKDIDGKDFSFGDLKGKKILIVNTASNCGYTPQYAELEELQKKIGNEKLVIVGVPSNDFGQQEPGTNAAIKSFCDKNYGVTFPMLEKQKVTGKEMSYLYAFLTQKSMNGVKNSNVEWNFQKYLINEDGELVRSFPSKVTPLSEEILTAIKSKTKKDK